VWAHVPVIAYVGADTSDKERQYLASHVAEVVEQNGTDATDVVDAVARVRKNGAGQAAPPTKTE
ncbi:hypothetical protein HQ560_12630, partial [bacterium]|nr:hypothetical protein [bacterium]